MRISIVGGGISGLSAAFWISKIAKKLKKEVLIDLYEKESCFGGSIYTAVKEGFHIESGPNGFLSSKPHTLALFNEASLGDNVIRSNDLSRKRYIYRAGKLRKVPEKPLEFLKSDLITMKGKMRILSEFLVPQLKTDIDETIAAFAERRLGKEARDYLISPMVSGIFAGDTAKMSLKSSFPVIYELEKNYGGLFKGLIKKKNKKGGPSGPSGVLMSYKNGMYFGVKDLASKCLDVTFHLNETVLDIDKVDNTFSLTTSKGSKSYDRVVLTLPAYGGSKIVEKLNPELSNLLDEIAYAPACVVGLGFKSGDILDNLDGFGFLVPAVEKRQILGILFSSSIFPERAPAGYKLIRIILGGDSNRWILDKEIKNLIDIAFDEAKVILKIKGSPVVTEAFMYEKAIPQYYVGHTDRVLKIERICKSIGGLFIGGNILYGIGINDCTMVSKLIAEKIFNV